MYYLNNKKNNLTDIQKYIYLLIFIDKSILYKFHI